jgi:HPr kinase/phosphorylase
LAEKKNVPLFKTPFPTSMFAAKINFYLEGEFAPTTVVHASLLDVFGQGVLIMEESGSGKSEAALELIERGHRFIADDSVLLKRVGRHLLIGSMGTGGPHHMEVRGMGWWTSKSCLVSVPCGRKACFACRQPCTQ